MSKEDNVEFSGEVIEALRGGHFKVALDTKNGKHNVIAYLAGQIQKNKITIAIGDAVTVAVSPYDMTKGRIIWRKK